MQQEVAKYKKKRKSNTSKSEKKSDHKHEWIPCFIHCNMPEKYFMWVTNPQMKERMRERFVPGYCCPICNKLRENADEPRHIKEGNNWHTITTEEYLNMHKDWKVYEIPSEEWYYY